MTFLTKQMHLERQSETVPSEQLGSAGDASKCREAGRREPGPSGRVQALQMVAVMKQHPGFHGLWYPLGPAFGRVLEVRHPAKAEDVWM